MPYRLQPCRLNDVKFTVSGGGPPVLFLHGIPTGPRLWDHVVRILSAGFTCVVVDLVELDLTPYLARSGPSVGEPTPDVYADALDALRAELSFSSWYVVGHDAGCVLAVHYAARFPDQVRRLVLCSAPIFPDLQIPWFFRLVRTPMIGELWAPLVLQAVWTVLRRSLGRIDPVNEEIVESFRAQFRGRVGIRRFVRLLRWGDPLDVLARTAALLPQISATALVLHGSRERVIPPNFAVRAASTIPNATVRFLECDHFVPLECPDGLCAAVLSFLLEPSHADHLGERAIRYLDRG